MSSPAASTASPSLTTVRLLVPAEHAPFHRHKAVVELHDSLLSLKTRFVDASTVGRHFHPASLRVFLAVSSDAWLSGHADKATVDRALAKATELANSQTIGECLGSVATSPSPSQVHFVVVLPDAWQRVLLLQKQSARILQWQLGVMFAALVGSLVLLVLTLSGRRWALQLVSPLFFGDFAAYMALKSLKMGLKSEKAKLVRRAQYQDIV